MGSVVSSSSMHFLYSFWPHRAPGTFGLDDNAATTTCQEDVTSEITAPFSYMLHIKTFAAKTLDKSILEFRTVKPVDGG